MSYENMSFIKLESVGSAVTSEGTVHPLNEDETLDMYDGMSGNVFECDDEWYWNLSLVDGWSLLLFTDAHIGWDKDGENPLLGDYEEWKEKVNGLMGCQDTLVEAI